MFRILSGLILSAIATITLANPQVIVETNRGNFTIELFEKEAPKTVANFLKYADEGFYDGTIFHRVIQDFMIQGGGFTKELSRKETRKPIKNEAKEELKNARGTIAMARTSAPHSATSQFFINVKDNTSLDYRPWNVGYAVFGKVTEGMHVVDNISYTQTSSTGMYQNVPTDAIEILKVTRVKAAAPAPQTSTQP